MKKWFSLILDVYVKFDFTDYMVTVNYLNLIINTVIN